MEKKRSISAFALLFASVSAILGSGWLFAVYYTSILAGPGAILSWVIGGVGVIIVGFVFAELCALLPITGASTRIPQYTHGGIVGFIFSWIIWLSYATLVPTEVQAVLQYISYFFPGLVHLNGGLTGYGYGMACILMLLISALNVFSLRWLLLCNNVLTVFKLLIPIFISLVLLACFMPTQHTQMITAHFMPFGIHGVFAAVASGGILFAFNGFKQACEMAGEAKRPYYALPFAIIGSVAICLVIYLLLQVAFLIALPGGSMAGLQKLAFHGSNSPLAALLRDQHLQALLPIVYLGAIIGPLAAGLIYSSSAARSLYGMGMNQQLPEIFKKLNVQGNPVFSIMANFVLGMCLFAPLPGWNSMITFLTSLMTLTYAVGPICLLTLRVQAPNYHRPFRLPYGTIWSILAFYICTLMIYWSGWEINMRLDIALIIGLGVLLVHHRWFSKSKQFLLNWRASIWIWPYFIGLTLMSYYGNFGHGKHAIPLGWDCMMLAPFCLIIVGLARHFRLAASETCRFIDALTLDKIEPVEGDPILKVSEGLVERVHE